MSVVLSVRNGEDYLKEAIDSILAQTWGDFELIVIDNHSSDQSATIVNNYEDSRIQLTRPSDPLHLAQALNHARPMVNGTFIARMDADDVAHPTRLQRQIEYMTAHPDVGVLGTQVRPIDGTGAALPGDVCLKPESHHDISWELYFGCPLWHPTVMIRKDVMDQLGWYSSPAILGREEYSAEDYDLWCRAITVTRIENISEVLLDYRIHDANHSLASHRRSQHMGNLVRILAQRIETSFDLSVDSTVCAAMLGIKPEELPHNLLPPGAQGSLPEVIHHLIKQAKQDGLAPNSMRALEEKLARASESLLWNQGFNILRGCYSVFRANPRMGWRVFVASLKRFF